MSFVILQGNCLDVLRTIPSNLIQTCVTSPPYFGLRDYGTASWEGGAPECDHRPPDEAGQTTKPTAGQREHAGGFVGANCHKCGAKRIDQQIGLEPTPQAFVDQLVRVFREVRRVLRADGTLWLNLGDSYAQAGGNGRQGGSSQRKGRSNVEVQMRNAISTRPPEGLKPKDLIGIPWRVAFALQQDGWYLRQDIIWHKPNPMPESVRDRCTKAHEYIFLLSKSEKYYFDAEAIKESCTSDERRPTFRGGAYVNNSTFNNSEGGKSTVVGNVRTGRAAGNKSHKYVEAYATAESEEHRTKAGLMKIAGTAYETRNKRSVWTVAPKPFKEAHFATFPPDLIRPCILAGAPVGGLVLDPFGGAGTTAMVSEQLKRHSISIELNPAYVEMARKRVAKALDSPPQS